MIVYLDTSILLRALLGHQLVLSEWGRWDRAYASELAGVEARRVIDRLRLDGALDDHGVGSHRSSLLVSKEVSAGSI